MTFLVSLGVFVLIIIISFIFLKNSQIEYPQSHAKIQMSCGLPHIQPSIDLDSESFEIIKMLTKIIGGQVTLAHSYPWIVSLRATYHYDLHYCSGSLVFSQIVITAAHCVVGMSVDEIQVAVGLNKRNVSFDQNNLYNVSAIRIHEYFADVFQVNDIAIIKLDRPVEVSDTVSTICLPESDDDFEDVFGKNVALAGWLDHSYIIEILFLIQKNQVFECFFI